MLENLVFRNQRKRIKEIAFRVISFFIRSGLSRLNFCLQYASSGKENIVKNGVETYTSISPTDEETSLGTGWDFARSKQSCKSESNDLEP